MYLAIEHDSDSDSDSDMWATGHMMSSENQKGEMYCDAL